MVTRRPCPPSRRPTGTRGPGRGRPGRPGRWPARLAGAVIVAAVATGCVGQRSRNDDHVGPSSFRPGAREHTMGPTGAGAGGT